MQIPKGMNANLASIWLKYNLIVHADVLFLKFVLIQACTCLQASTEPLAYYMYIFREIFITRDSLPVDGLALKVMFGYPGV